LKEGERMIEFNNVTKIYKSANKKVKAVDNISMQIEKGNICVLLGPSGCGKTTLLRMVNRLIPLTSGTIKVNGNDTENMDIIQLRRSIGYVIQQNGLFPNMTIEENICVVPKLLGWDRIKMKKRYNELMDMMGLNPDEFRKRFPHELSGGQQQRIGVARALAADPPVMLMDEPFGALDPVIRERIQNEFLRIQKEVKKTIVFVSHDIDEAIRLGDKIAILKSGQIMQYDTPDNILANPKNKFVQDFIGEDRAIKRLTLLTVRDLIKKFEGLRNKGTKDLSETISINENLRTALSKLLSIPTGEAIVIDDNKKKIGVLRVSDFEVLTDIDKNEISVV
jgi:osmoprotectant transport system ATP-binding protein